MNSFQYVVSFVLPYNFEQGLVCALQHGDWGPWQVVQKQNGKWNPAFLRGVGWREPFIIWAVLSLDSLFHSSLFVTACSSFQYILQYVVYWRAASLTIRRLAPPYFSFSEIRRSYMVRINFKNSFPDFLTIFLSCLLTYLPFVLKFSNLSALEVTSFSASLHSKIIRLLFFKVFVF